MRVQERSSSNQTVKAWLSWPLRAYPKRKGRSPGRFPLALAGWTAVSAAPCVISGPGTAPAAVLLSSLSLYLSLLKCFHQHRPKNLLFSQLEKTFFLFSSHPYSRSFALQICDHESKGIITSKLWSESARLGILSPIYLPAAAMLSHIFLPTVGGHSPPFSPSSILEKRYEDLSNHIFFQC